MRNIVPTPQIASGKWKEITIGKDVHLKSCKMCECPEEPHVYWFYIKETANRKNYVVRCGCCTSRTRNRRKLKCAIEEWNKGNYF